MLSWQQAREAVIETVRARGRRPGREWVRLGRALGRVLAEPVSADRDLPAFPRSIRDGFALRAADTNPIPSEFQIVAEIKAGESYSGTIGHRQAARIMTGAPVPAGADAVVMVEHTREISPSRVAIERAARPGDHIVPQGAEGRAGQKLLDPGRRIGFGELALLAQVGCERVRAFRQPRVAVLTTGDEIVPVGAPVGPYQIRDTNGVSLGAQVALAGALVTALPPAADDSQTLSDRIREGLEADVLVMSGGVSKGKYDLVEGALRGLGAELQFDEIAIRPGRPAVFGWCAGKPVFGLPGNPVSTMVTFELLVVPALDLLGGGEPRPLPLVGARLEAPLEEKEGLTHFLPARVEWTAKGAVTKPVSWRGSGDVAGMAQANGFLVVPADRARGARGEVMDVLLRRDLL